MALFCRYGLTRHLRQHGKLRVLRGVQVSPHSSANVDTLVRHLIILSACEKQSHLQPRSHVGDLNKLSQPVCVSSCRSYAKRPKKEKKGPSKVELSSEEVEGVLDLEAYKMALQHVVDQQKEDYIQHLTLRTTAGVFHTIKVHTDDGTFPINQLGQIAQKSPSLVMINMAASPQYIPAVKEAIVSSGLNVNPQQEANTLFVPLPKVTKEHREGLAKSAKTLCDKSKEKLRDLFNKQARKLKQAKGSHSDDLLKKIQELILEEMHKSCERAEEMMKAKQNDLLGH